MKFDSPNALLYHLYNSLFLRLPFQGIEAAGTRLALFGQFAQAGFEAGKSPAAIIESFWKEYFEDAPEEERLGMLFYFIQYIERQVVLFDSVEDALFEQTHEMHGPGSLKHLLTRLDSAPKREKMLQKIRDFNIRLVLTAHPTQFYPGKVLGIINDLGLEIKGNRHEQVRLLLMQLGKTAFVNRAKPTPYDEAISLGWYMEHVFYHALPDILFRLLHELGQDLSTFENPRLLSLGFWPGGDRDGNPFVTSETTLKVAQRLREGALRGYYRDIRQVKRRLSFRNVEDIVGRVENTIYNTLYGPGKDLGIHIGTQAVYASCTELLSDLADARKILIDEHQSLFLEELDRLILKIKVFGFYFASLDIRQESGKHREVWTSILQTPAAGFDPDSFAGLDENAKINRLLSANFPLKESDFDDPLVKETILSLKTISEIQRSNGEPGCHRYIISNCGSALQVAEVLALARLTMGYTAGNGDPMPATAIPRTVPLDVVPLFETVEDLAAAGDVMTTLYTNDLYAAHVAARGNTQHIMLGFSDGTKDGGYFRANWSIYRAKEALTSVSRKHGVTVIFFDGRGGPPGRGGGNNASYYAAQGREIENQAIHVTIQGQTVSSTYGTQSAAMFNIERLLSAGLENHLFQTHDDELTAADRLLLEELAETAYQSYLTLKNHPAFVPYLEKMTPLKWYGDSNIASRPTKRSGDQKLRFEDLRAIPFVGAWAQMKQNVPGYYGVGAAIASLKDRKLAELRALYKHSLFFRTLLENSMQSLIKSNFAVTQYLAGHPQFGVFWEMLHHEFELTRTQLLDLSGEKDLLADNPMSLDSILLRESIVLPLIAIQQFALQKLQDETLLPALADTYRKMVLRAMFGIINAARNAA